MVVDCEECSAILRYHIIYLWTLKGGIGKLAIKYCPDDDRKKHVKLATIIGNDRREKGKEYSIGIHQKLNQSAEIYVFMWALQDAASFERWQVRGCCTILPEISTQRDIYSARERERCKRFVCPCPTTLRCAVPDLWGALAVISSLLAHNP